MDHYQILALMNQVPTNLQIKPRKISADTNYSTLVNLQYPKELGITTVIPTKQQNKKNFGNLPDNPFTINYLVFDEYKNIFICPNNEELSLDETFQHHKKND